MLPEQQRENARKHGGGNLSLGPCGGACAPDQEQQNGENDGDLFGETGQERRRADPLSDFWAEAMRLRDLFKFEFFFSEKDSYREQLREELAFQDSDWEAKLVAGADVAGALVRSFRPFCAHRVLRPFVRHGA